MGSKTRARELDGGRRRADRARHDRARRRPSRPPRGDRRRRSATRSRSRRPAAAAARASASRAPRTSSRRPSRAPRARASSSSRDADRLPRALPARPAPRRGAGPRRRPRQRHPPRRARLLGPAPPPEADRGVARRRGVDDALRGASARSRATPRARSATAAPGTIEGLLADGEYYFLEMNTRVQVEHCVTEMVTGIDIVREQVRIAAGRAAVDRPGGRRAARPRDRVPHQRRGRRRRTSRPPRGRSTAYREPAGPGVRVDSGVRAGSEISPDYDPMVAKLIVWDPDRAAATRADAARAGRVRDRGPDDALPVPPRRCWRREQWARGETCRDLVEDKAWLKALALRRRRTQPQTTEDEDLSVEQTYTVEVAGQRFDVRVLGAAAAAAWPTAPLRRPRAAAPRARGGRGRRRRGTDALVSPIQGTVLKVAVEQGAQVEPGALIAVVEAMKMENEITAHKAGTVPSCRSRSAPRWPPATPSRSSPPPNDLRLPAPRRRGAQPGAAPRDRARGRRPGGLRGDERPARAGGARARGVGSRRARGPRVLGLHRPGKHRARSRHQRARRADLARAGPPRPGAHGRGRGARARQLLGAGRGPPPRARGRGGGRYRGLDRPAPAQAPLGARGAGPRPARGRGRAGAGHRHAPRRAPGGRWNADAGGRDPHVRGRPRGHGRGAAGPRGRERGHPRAGGRRRPGGPRPGQRARARRLLADHRLLPARPAHRGVHRHHPDLVPGTPRRSWAACTRTPRRSSSRWTPCAPAWTTSSAA